MSSKIYFPCEVNARCCWTASHWQWCIPWYWCRWLLWGSSHSVWLSQRQDWLVMQVPEKRWPSWGRNLNTAFLNQTSHPSIPSSCLWQWQLTDAWTRGRTWGASRAPDLRNSDSLNSSYLSYCSLQQWESCDFLSRNCILMIPFNSRYLAVMASLP